MRRVGLVGLGAVLGSVVLCRFFGLFLRLHAMTLSNMRVVRRLLVIARFVMFRGFMMVLGRVLVMLGRLLMVFNRVVCHSMFLSRVD
jgi:hypothetical protein